MTKKKEWTEVKDSPKAKKICNIEITIIPTVPIVKNG